MTADQIIAAAQRNMARRRQQISRLAPVGRDARARSESFREQRTGAKAAIQEIEQMKGLKFIPNFFPTPRPVVARMLEVAEPSAGERVLEPSAGKGNLCLALRPYSVTLHAIEQVRTLAELVRAGGFECECADFLQTPPTADFDLVFMNPPFERGTDEEHILHAFRFLRPGGRLVSVAGATTGARLKSWAVEKNGSVEALPANSFAASERPTGVSTVIVIARASG